MIKINSSILPYRVLTANTFITRLIGLLGHAHLPENKVLLLKTSCSIHTFGMKFPVDVVFLDDSNNILKIETLKPNRIAKAPVDSVSALEFAAGQAQQQGIQIGDELEIESDQPMQTNLSVLTRLAHWPVNLVLGMFWGCLAFRSIELWIAEKSLVGLSLFLVNTLIFVLFLSRRPSQQTSKSFLEWAVAFATVLFSFLLRPDLSPNPLLVKIFLPIQLAGIVLMGLSLLSLGRSFGIVPSNRTVKQKGAFQIVRHPLYVSELVYYFAFLMSNVTPLNAVLVLGIFLGQLYRAGAEEKLLSHDPAYQQYRVLVKYRFIPGLY